MLEQIGGVYRTSKLLMFTCLVVSQRNEKHAMMARDVHCRACLKQVPSVHDWINGYGCVRQRNGLSSDSKKSNS